ncbi:hypothetical protein GGX14DRAFT_638117 [Mycena pura]|uniref:Homeobox domain-containing protein n=1 Tax=Mycena pura TaxID=153505 RepID=A0AAD6YNY4_9AGAR|nr:hypothetical protein GGX14DRAFT_638117 [Mycena pura]
MSLESIRERLILIESQFLGPIALDSDAIISFIEKWAQLEKDLEVASRGGLLDRDTATMAYAVAHNITSVSDGVLLTETMGQNATEELVEMLERIDLDPQTARAEPRGRSQPQAQKSVTPRADSSLPLYIEPAYRWLLKHLHNPYPSKSIKEKIANATSATTVEQVSAWFVDVRRRMGWTRLLKDEFGKKRTDMVDAARRYFVRAEAARPLSPAVQVRFGEIEAFAQAMYAAKLLPAKADKLTPEQQEKARRERLRKAKAAKAYPSPAPSGASSPVSESGASLAGRKRSSSEASSDSEDDVRKRSRVGDSPPTPPDSARPSPSPPSRKRRLSESEAQSAPKRPRFRNASAPVAAATVTLSDDPDFLSDWFATASESDADLFNSPDLLDITLFDQAAFEHFEEESPVASPPEKAVALPPPDTLTFDIPGDSPELQQLLESFSPELFQYDPLVSDTFLGEPGVYNPSDLFFDPQQFSGYNYDHEFITRESAADAVYTTFSDEKASNLYTTGLFEEHPSENTLPALFPSIVC